MAVDLLKLVEKRPTPTGLFSLLGLSSNPSNSGFQRAHIIGVGFVRRPAANLQWLATLLGPNGADVQFNSVLLPEAERGSAILGTALHFQEHIEPFNTLFFDSDDEELDNSNKYLNVIRLNIIDDLEAIGLELSDLGDPAAAAIVEQGRIQIRNLLDYAKILFLHRENLDKLIDIDTGEVFPSLQSLALNDYDIRFESAADVEAWLQAFDADGLLDYSRLVGDPAVPGSGDPLFARISELRTENGGDVDIDNKLIEIFPELTQLR